MPFQRVFVMCIRTHAKLLCLFFWRDASLTRIWWSWLMSQILKVGCSCVIGPNSRCCQAFSVVWNEWPMWHCGRWKCSGLQQIWDRKFYYMVGFIKWSHWWSVKLLICGDGWGKIIWVLCMHIGIAAWGCSMAGDWCNNLPGGCKVTMPFAALLIFWCPCS